MVSATLDLGFTKFGIIASLHIRTIYTYESNRNVPNVF